MNTRYCFLILLSIISVNASAAITKWIDSSGQVHYSDQPAPMNTTSSDIKVHIAPVDEEAAKQKLHDIDAEIDQSYKQEKLNEGVEKLKRQLIAAEKEIAKTRARTTTTTVTTTTWSTRVPAGQPRLTFSPMGGAMTGGTVSPPTHR